MILDSLRNKQMYYGMSPRIRKAFEWLETADLAGLTVGKHAIDGDDIFVNVSELELRPRTLAALEVHNQYIDIQIVLGGEEEFGWSPRHTLTQPRGEFNAEKDIAFFEDKPETFYSLHEGEFTILMPQDAHAPMLGSGFVRKMIIKVKI